MKRAGFIVGAVTAFTLPALLFTGSALDDPWIFARYARNLLLYGEVVWNAGEAPVEGFTSWAWLLVQTGGLWLGWHPLGFARLAGIACGALLVALAARTIRNDAPGGPALLALALLSLAPDLAYWAASGMDNILWALSSWVWLISFSRAERLTAGHAAVAALLLLVRPEAIVLLALCALRAACEVAIRREAWRRAALALGTGGMILVVLTGMRYALFGKLLANSVFAKHIGGSILGRVFDGGFYLCERGSPYLVPSGLLLAAALATPGWPDLRTVLAGRRLRRAACMVAFIVLTLGTIVLAGGDDRSAFPYARLIVPLLAPLAWCLAIGLPAPANARRAGAALCIAGAAVLAGYLPRAGEMAQTSAGLTNLGATAVSATLLERAAPREPLPLSTWLLERTPPSMSIAIPWAGRIAYETDLPVVDLLGLNDPHIASLSPPQRGIDVKYDALYVLAKRPFVVCEAVRLRLPTERIARMNDAELYAAGAWKVGQRALLTSPRFAEEYEWAADAPTGELGTCFQRRR